MNASLLAFAGSLAAESGLDPDADLEAGPASRRIDPSSFVTGELDPGPMVRGIARAPFIGSTMSIDHMRDGRSVLSMEAKPELLDARGSHHAAGSATPSIESLSELVVRRPEFAQRSGRTAAVRWLVEDVLWPKVDDSQPGRAVGDVGQLAHHLDAGPLWTIRWLHATSTSQESRFRPLARRHNEAPAGLRV